MDIVESQRNFDAVLSEMKCKELVVTKWCSFRAASIPCIARFCRRRVNNLSARTQRRMSQYCVDDGASSGISTLRSWQ